ncbi:DUF4124 domain-containing protein [Chitinilyticum litopenaei]|uniref:DUF4124 domain-containing protein n=1 Tax=Chitinilyticum litopenaei TaxID=1121276 RepID=UPI0003FA0F4F|nr:DUF4124 domain-containing protein [Chitinilyticum litopenaei]
MTIRSFLLPAALLVLASPLALADIYKYVDENGNVVFTNERNPPKGAQRVYIDTPSVIYSGSPPPKRSSSNSGSSGGTQKVNTPSPANFPKVDAETQRSRDSNRKRILQDELSNEQSLLTQARKALGDAEGNKSADEKANPSKYLERLGRLRETVVMHEKNVAALQKELSRVQ